MCSALVSRIGIYVHNDLNERNISRPLSLDGYVGQDMIKEQIKIKVNLFKKTRTVMCHTLLLGFPGAGKTTLARIIASELGVNYYEFMAQDFPTGFKIVDFFKSIEPNSVVFIDEIHALNKSDQEFLYPILEDYSFSGKQLGKKFTVIGATTHAGLLNSPFLDRFGFKPVMTPYTSDQLNTMLSNFYSKMNSSIDLPQEVLMSIATLCQGVPRKGINLIKNFFDYINATIDEYRMLEASDFTLEKLSKCLQSLDLDPFLGLDRLSRDYLNVLYSEKSKPIGSKSLATMCNIQEVTLINVIEPFLLSQYIKMPVSESDFISGPLVKMTRQGRVPTESTEVYLKSCKKLQEEFGWFQGEIFSI
jgi:Holliday junction DNA helicase RuvB